MITKIDYKWFNRRNLRVYWIDQREIVSMKCKNNIDKQNKKFQIDERIAFDFWLFQNNREFFKYSFEAQFKNTRLFVWF